MMFPSIIIKPNVKYYIRDKLMNDIKEILKDLPLTNSIEDILDKSIIEKNGWMMYGSCKPGHQVYKLKHIFDYELDEIEEESADISNFSSDSYFFSIIRYNEDDMCQLQDNVVDEINKYNVISKTNKVKKIKTLKEKNNLQFDNYNDKYVDDIFKTNQQITYEEICKLMNILSKDRSDNYDDWIRLGYALHNINKYDNDKYLKIWIEFSKLSSKYKPGECEKSWKKMKNIGLSVNSIYYWAKTDNEYEYKKFIEGNITNVIKKSLLKKNINNTDVALIMRKLYRDEFICSDAKNGTWYQYKNNKWNLMDSNVRLRNKIFEDVNQKLYALKHNFEKKKLDENISEDDVKIIGDNISSINKTLNKLGDTSFKNNVMKECIGFFLDEKFEESLNENPNLIGFENGIYDLKEKRFRKGEPEDYVSFSTKINYEDYDENKEEIAILDKFLSTVFPKKINREYALKYLASCLEGGNKHEQFMIWIGSGSNGKSKLNELFMKSFGDYCIKFPISLITQQRAKSNACSPNLVLGKGKRYGIFDEPNANDVLQDGLLKELTGGDDVIARGLYQKQAIRYKPLFNLTLLCNSIPKVENSSDEAIWRRIKAQEFTSKFCKNPNENNKNEYEIDYELSKKLASCRELFISMLINKYYPLYQKEGLEPPEDVVKFTKEYEREADAYKDFLNECVIDSQEKSDNINIDKLYNVFKDWYEQEINTTCPKRKEFKKKIKRNFNVARIKNNSIMNARFNKEFVDYVDINTNNEIFEIFSN